MPPTKHPSVRRNLGIFGSDYFRDGCNLDGAVGNDVSHSAHRVLCGFACGARRRGGGIVSSPMGSVWYADFVLDWWRLLCRLRYPAFALAADSRIRSDFSSSLALAVARDRAAGSAVRRDGSGAESADE